MQHKGEILEKAVRDSGMPLTKLAHRLKKVDGGSTMPLKIRMSQLITF
ncbi:MAG: hypothetical protein ACKO6J_04805 [Crocinitomicaceae bacterium]